MEQSKTNLVLELGSEKFEQLVGDKSGLVLIDFWAEWCGPCRTLAPIVEAVAADFPDQLQVYRVNVDDHPSVARRYEVRGIPTLLLFRNGELIERIVGVQPKTAIEERINRELTELV